MSDDVKVRQLMIKQAVSDALSRYCRGLDRMDRALALSVFHPQSTALYHDMYEGSGPGFIDWVWQAHAGMERHSHQISNVLVGIDGEAVCSEAYVTVALWTQADADGAQQEIIGRGRYLDRWVENVQRPGTWVIMQREHVLDMQTVTALTAGPVNTQSRRDTDDASYGFIPQ